MSLIVIATIGSLAVTQTLDGTLALNQTLLDQSATFAKFQAAVSLHTAINPNSISAVMEFSDDSGQTWNAVGNDPFPVSCGRSKGFDGDTLMTLTALLPLVGSTTRMLRGSLTTSGPIITAAAIQIMSGSA